MGKASVQAVLKMFVVTDRYRCWTRSGTLDGLRKSDNLTLGSSELMQPLRRVMAKSEARILAATMAVLVLGFCFSGVWTAVVGMIGCGGLESAAKVCGKSSGADPAPVAFSTSSVPPLAQETTFLLALFPADLSVPQFHPDLSAPRAPPLFHT